MTKCLHVAVSGCIFMAGCSLGDEPHGVLYPLELGTRWTYQLTTYDDNGNEQGVEIQTDTIIGVWDFKEGRFACKSSHVVGGETYPFWLRNAARGVEDTGVTYNPDTDLPWAVPPNLFLKYPAKPGDSYITMQDVDGEMEERATVARADAKVNVPAGEYECIEYHFEETKPQQKTTMIIFASPGVGIVREVGYDYETGKQSHVLELTELKLPE